MFAAPKSHRRLHALTAIALLTGLLAAWFAYAPGIGGIPQFDDRANLSDLDTVRDPESAFRFVAKGTAGPTGRPLALASFMAQAYAWPDAPEVLLRTNILIHLLNGLLVTWLLYLIGVARAETAQRAALIAVGSGSIWMLMPLLASSSLFIVQRMTTLSAVFTLLGAVGYMYARQRVDQRPRTALFAMTLALGAGTILGVLAKETGALLFLFILAVEVTLLDRPLSVSPRLWKTWLGVFFIGPLVALLVYLASALPYPESLVLRRDFTGMERLITQAEILWKYLYLAFIPNISSLGPFHDDYPIQRNLLSPTALLFAGAWITAAVGAVMLRRKAPLFSFAVAWYLFGHLLESTTLSLELYFEHRNYLPLVGPAYALVASLSRLDRERYRVVGLVLVLYMSTLAGVLFKTTSLWGSRELAAEMWQLYRPESLRATQHLAGELEREGYFFASRRLLGRYLEENPDAHGVRLQVLVLSCHIEPTSDHTDAILTLEETLPIARFDYSVLAAFQQLYRVTRDDQCPSVDRVTLYRLGQTLLRNPRLNLPRVKHSIHVTMARIGIEQGDLGLAMSHINDALDLFYNFDTVVLAMNILTSAGRHDLAWELLNEARATSRTKHPLRATQRKIDLDRVERALNSFEKSLGEAAN